MNVIGLATTLCFTVLLAQAETAQQRLMEAREIVTEIMATPDKGIPQDLLDKAHCMVIVPGMKQAAFTLGGKYGRGFAVCRQKPGGWGAPAAVRVEGGSVGFQIGASSTDAVMLVMSERGMRRLLEDKFTLGAQASAAAGPVGRTRTFSRGRGREACLQGSPSRPRLFATTSTKIVLCTAGPWPTRRS